MKLYSTLFFVSTFCGVASFAHAQIPVKLPDVGNSQWAAKCGQTGGYEACENLADQNFKGTGVTKSPHMTAYYLLQACKYGNYEMCEFAYGMAETQAESKFIQGEASLILCEKTNPQYCAVPHSLFSNESKPQYMPRLVSRSLEMGCDKDDAVSCSKLGPWYDDYKLPRGVTVDLGKALTGYSKACQTDIISNPVLSEKDIASMCYFTYKYSTQLKSPTNFQDIAEDAFIRSCQFGNSDTCETALSSFVHGINDIRKNNTKAVKVAQRTCDLGVSSGCDFVAISLFEKKDFTGAFDAFSKSCDTSPSLNSCVGAANTAFRVKGEKSALTTKYTKLGCEQGDGWSCYTYGFNTFYLTENGNRPFFQKACDLNYAEGCAEVRRQEEQEVRNAQIDDYNEHVRLQQLNPPTYTPAPSWDDYMRAGQEYWRNWKPSYCSNRSITSRDGRTTTRAECTDY